MSHQPPLEQSHAPAEAPTADRHHAIWRRAGVAVLVTALAGAACTAYASWAGSRAFGPDRNGCRDYLGMPLIAQAAAWAGPIVGAVVVIAVPVLLWVGTRRPTPFRSLLLPLLKTMLAVSLLLLLIEVRGLLVALPNFGPHAAIGDC